MRPARLLAEVKDVAANHHPQYEVFVSEADIGFWKVVIRALFARHVPRIYAHGRGLPQYTSEGEILYAYHPSEYQ